MNSRTPSSRTSRSSRSSRPRSRDSLSREERKEATRRAIVAAAMKLLEDRSFAALSLREVTREAGIVPAAFYRHFESMEALGLVLIDESFRRLGDRFQCDRSQCESAYSGASQYGASLLGVCEAIGEGAGC